MLSSNDSGDALPWNSFPPYLTGAEEEQLQSLLLPWIVFGFASCVFTILFGVVVYVWNLRLRKQQLLQQQTHTKQKHAYSKLEAASSPVLGEVDYLDHIYNAKRIAQKRFAALLVVFCILLLFSAIATFIFYINNRADENMSLATQEIQGFIQRFSLLAVEAYNDVPNQQIQQYLSKLNTEIVSFNSSATTTSQIVLKADHWREVATVLFHSLSILTLFLLLVGSVWSNGVLSCFLVLSFPMLMILWLASTLNAMTSTALSFSCTYGQELLVSFANSTLQGQNYTAAIQLLFECITNGEISNQTQAQTGLSFAIEEGNSSFIASAVEFNNELRQLSIEPLLNISRIGEVRIGNSVTLQNSWNALNFTISSLDLVENGISAASPNLTQKQTYSLQTSAETLGGYLRASEDLIYLSNCSDAQQIYQHAILYTICNQVTEEIQWLGMAALASGMCFIGLIIFALILSTMQTTILFDHRFSSSHPNHSIN